MVMDIILITIAFVALIIGTITDIKKREVPDWLNFSLILSGIGLRLLYSSITFEWSYLMEGVIGLLAFVIFGYLMFYTGQWGGGDSKMLMGLGALLGIPFTLHPTPLILVFLVNILLVGSIYGLVWSIVLAIKHRKKFIKNYIKIVNDPKLIRWRRIALVSTLIMIFIVILFSKFKSLDILSISLITLAILIAYLSIHLIMFIKAVELSAMFKLVSPEELTEGDWIAKEIKINGEKIVSPKDLGIDKKQIRKLIKLKKQRKIKNVKIKMGIPFVPSFLLAFILSLILGAWWIAFF